MTDINSGNMEIRVILRIGAILAGTAGLVLFLLPVFTGRIINIGNMTGLIVSSCLLFYGRFQTRLHAAAAGIPEKGLPVKCAAAAGAFLLSAVLITAAVLTAVMVRETFRKPPEGAAVIVLGCQVKGDRPSLMLLSRVEAAASWMQEHPGCLCIVSGGKGEDEEISEAECMRRLLTERGIAGERILMEDRSVSTRENLLFSARILKEKGLDAKAAIVTSGFHACRAHLIARSLGIEDGSVPAGSPWWLLPTFYVRELYGLLFQILAGR